MAHGTRMRDVISVRVTMVFRALLAVCGCAALAVLGCNNGHDRSAGRLQEGAAISAAEEERLVKQLLQRALSHSPVDRQFVEGLKSESSSERVRALALVLIEEWGQQPDTPSLQQPRLVFLPAQGEEEIVLQRSLRGFGVLVMGTVGEDGIVREARVVRSSGSPAFDMMYLRRFEQSLFRPARDNDKYVRRQSGLSLRF